MGKRVALSCQLESFTTFLAGWWLKEGLGLERGLVLELGLDLKIGFGLGKRLDLELGLGLGKRVGVGLRSGLEVMLSKEPRLGLEVLGAEENLTDLFVQAEIRIFPNEKMMSEELGKIQAYFDGIEILNLDRLTRLVG